MTSSKLEAIGSMAAVSAGHGPITIPIPMTTMDPCANGCSDAPVARTTAGPLCLHCAALVKWAGQETLYPL